MGYLGSSTNFHKVGPTVFSSLHCLFETSSDLPLWSLFTSIELPSGRQPSIPFMRVTTIFHVGTIYPFPIVLSCSVLLNADGSLKLPFHLPFPAYPDFICSWINMPAEMQSSFEQSFHCSLLLMDMNFFSLDPTSWKDNLAFPSFTIWSFVSGSFHLVLASESHCSTEGLLSQLCMKKTGFPSTQNQHKEKIFFLSFHMSLFMKS